MNEKISWLLLNTETSKHFKRGVFNLTWGFKNLIIVILFTLKKEVFNILKFISTSIINFLLKECYNKVHGSTNMQMQPFLVNALHTENLRFFSDIGKTVASFFFLKFCKHKHVIMDSIQRNRTFYIYFLAALFQIGHQYSPYFFSLCCQLSIVSLSS